MSQLVVHGAFLRCSFGAAPVPLIVLPKNRCMAGGLPVATILDAVPLLNIPTFGVCMAIPSFPVPCIPKTCAWCVGKKTLLGGLPIIDQSAKAMCGSGGIIQVIYPGQLTVQHG